MTDESWRRFWSKVDPTSPFLGCWSWAACVNPAGYGILRWQQRAQLAHRVAWSMLCGTIPDGLCVLHRCDNPRCVNPAHLFLGTQAENVHDMDAKGRRVNRPVYGASHHNAKLTDAAVEQIRARRAVGQKQAQIAEAFGVAQVTISRIVTGRGWTHV